MKRLLLLICWTILAGCAEEIRDARGTLISLPYETEGQRHWFATPSGTGDCTSWDDACTFRNAVSKTLDAYQDVIHLSPGNFDCDNGSDANGTTISADNVMVIGSGIECQYPSRFLNSDAAAAFIIRVTGDSIAFKNVRFSNKTQTDPNVTHLEVQGNRSSIQNVKFAQDNGEAVSGKGIVYTNSSTCHHVDSVHFEQIMTAALETNAAEDIIARNLEIYESVVGINVIGGASDSHMHFDDVYLEDNTTAVNIDAGATNIIFYRPRFVDNVTRIVDSSGYDEVHIIAPRLDHEGPAIYPTGAGVTVTGGAGAYEYGDLTQIVPADAITTPFVVADINFQSATASNIFKLQIYYGEASGSAVLFGTYEFSAGATPVLASITAKPVMVREFFPSNSYIGAKLASSSGGGDTVVITISDVAL